MRVFGGSNSGARRHAMARAMPWKLLTSLAMATAGCSSGSQNPTGAGGAGGTGAGGGAGTAAPLTYKPCDQTTKVGGFSIQLLESTAKYTSIGGRVRDSVDPTDIWDELVKEGDCRIKFGRQLTCAPGCAATQFCAGNNQCVAQPVSQDVGTVTVSGLAMPVSIFPVNKQYSGSLDATFPPFAPNADVKLRSGGGAYAAFTLSGRGITPLVFPGTGLNLSKGQPLTVTWTPPPAPESARIVAVVDIAHHGGIAAKLECDVADSGSLTIPATLISQLIDRGTAGFPTVSLTRRTMDSTMVTPGCVDLAVASAVEREASVEGVISCSQDLPCPAGKTCGADLKCS